MIRAIPIRSTLLVAIPLLSSVISAEAAVIVGVNNGSNCCGAGINVGTAAQISWTQSQTFQHVSIVVPLFSWTGNVPFHVNAFLTSASGTGATPPPLASSSFTGTTSFGVPINATLFSGLTLGPGTYYLTLSGTDPSTGPNGAIWVGAAPGDPTLAIATANGVTTSAAYQANGGILNAVYPPASSFILDAPPQGGGLSQYLVTVTGDTIAQQVPALSPGGIAVLGVLLASTGLMLRKSTPRRS